MPQWSEFFQVKKETTKDWKVQAFVMVSEERFRRAGLLPNRKIPPGGLQQGNQIWVRVAPGDYYTRHLLLHEGTHAFSWFQFRNLGAPWLAEGIAEHLALHQYQDGKLTLAANEKNKNRLAYWGRIKPLREAAESKKIRPIREVFLTPETEFPKTVSYAWAWAAVKFLDSHPKTKTIFRKNLSRLITKKTDIQRLFKKRKPCPHSNWVTTGWSPSPIFNMVWIPLKYRSTQKTKTEK